MDDIFGGSGNGSQSNANAKDDALDVALIDLVPVPADIKGTEDPSETADPFGIF